MQWNNVMFPATMLLLLFEVEEEETEQRDFLIKIAYVSCSLLGRHATWSLLASAYVSKKGREKPARP